MQIQRNLNQNLLPQCIYCPPGKIIKQSELTFEALLATGEKVVKFMKLTVSEISLQPIIYDVKFCDFFHLEKGKIENESLK